MALFKCKECATEISSKAETCPKCGTRVAAKPMGCGTLIFLAGIIVSAFLGILSSIGSHTSSPPTIPSSASSAQTAPTPQPKLPGSQWSYQKSDDAMGKGAIYQAQVSSSNTVDFDFPYSGAQHATLTLRTHPRYGKDIIFSIEKGQFLCRSYDEDCTVLVRSDNEKAVNYSAVGAADNSTETIFIRNYDRFVTKMLKAKQMRIAVNIYQEGAPVFEFDVSNFDQNKYKPKK